MGISVENVSVTLTFFVSNVTQNFTIALEAVFIQTKYDTKGLCEYGRRKTSLGFRDIEIV